MYPIILTPNDGFAFTLLAFRSEFVNHDSVFQNIKYTDRSALPVAEKAMIADCIPESATYESSCLFGQRCSSSVLVTANGMSHLCQGGNQCLDYL